MEPSLTLDCFHEEVEEEDEKENAMQCKSEIFYVYKSFGK